MNLCLAGLELRSCFVSFASVIMNSREHQIPQKLEVQYHWDKMMDECQLIPLNCTWPMTSKKECLTVTNTCLKWTFNYDFEIRVADSSQGNRNFWN